MGGVFLNRSLRRFLPGLREHPWRFLVGGGVAFASMWTATEAVAFFLEEASPGWPGLLVLLGISACVAVYRTAPVAATTIRIKSLNLTIEVSFGDLFEVPGHKVVPANEFFDTEIGQPVERASLHGQLIVKKFNGNSNELSDLIDVDLRGVDHEVVDRPKGGRTAKYAIGTTAVVEQGDEKIFLPALTRTNIDTFEVSADVPTLWVSLEGLWKAVRARAGGQPLAVPLVGSGLARMNLGVSQLLDLLLMSLVNASREQRLSSKVRIVLWEPDHGEIDLESLLSRWV